MREECNRVVHFSSTGQGPVSFLEKISQLHTASIRVRANNADRVSASELVLVVEILHLLSSSHFAILRGIVGVQTLFVMHALPK